MIPPHAHRLPDRSTRPEGLGWWSWALSLALPLALGACASVMPAHPDTTLAAVPTQWSTSPSGSDSAMATDLAQWWTRFQDAPEAEREKSVLRQEPDRTYDTSAFDSLRVHIVKHDDQVVRLPHRSANDLFHGSDAERRLALLKPSVNHRMLPDTFGPH